MRQMFIWSLISVWFANLQLPLPSIILKSKDWISANRLNNELDQSSFAIPDDKFDTWPLVNTGLVNFN